MEFKVKQYDSFYINGQWVKSTGSQFGQVINPATEAVVAEVVEGTVEDVDRAVQAARAAFDSWSSTPSSVRADYLRKIAKGLQARVDEVALAISNELGSPLQYAKSVQAQEPVDGFNLYADYASLMDEVEHIHNSMVVREAVGVCSFINPWNYPLFQIVGKVAPALAAGCTMVVKPSEITPINAFILAEVIHEAGLPAGVFNLVSGIGPVVGEAMCVHPEVDMVSFTGSTRAGTRIAELAAPTVKRVCQELGGKSPMLITEDVDSDALAAAVNYVVEDVMFNTGQTCTALTRLLVPRSRLDEANAIAKASVEALVVGDPLSDDTFVGPMSSDRQRDTVQGYINIGLEEGATLLTGGLGYPDGLSLGYFVRPTVFTNVSNDMRIAREEIFGPVMCILPYESLEEGIRIANDTPYGLSSAVWAASKDDGLAIARKIRAGQVYVNGGEYNLEAPFGGYKQSGNGREWGAQALHEFIEIKAIQL